MCAKRWLLAMLCLAPCLCPAQKSPGTDDAVARARELENRLPAPQVQPKDAISLSPARLERLQKFLPKSLRTLNQREPFHLLVIADPGTLDLWQAEGETPAPTWPEAFASRVADQFFYSGGVRTPGAAPQVAPLLGPSLTLRVLSRAEGCLADAPGILASTARQFPVNLVILCHGLREAAEGQQPPEFANQAAAAVDAARALGAEVILCSPWLPAAPTAEAALGLPRPLADALAELAEAEGILHADLGDLASLLPLPSGSGNQDEGHVFEQIEKTYREHFHEAEDGRLQPRSSLHRQAGRVLFQALLDGAPSVPWTLTHEGAIREDDDHLTLKLKLRNPLERALEATVLPLIAAGWKPVEASPRITVGAGAESRMDVRYARVTGADASPVQEALVRLPVLVAAEDQCRVETQRAGVAPVAVVWNLDTAFNQEGAFSLGCQLSNPGGNAVSGNWTATFQGKTLQGAFEVKPGSSFPLDLRFDLPADGPRSEVVPLQLKLECAGVTHTSTRQVTLTRNLGLEQTRVLTPLGKAQEGQEITLQAIADKNRLNFVIDLGKTDLNPDAGSPAWQMEWNVDARSYGKRLEPGATATLRATGTAAEQAGVVHEVVPWAFGTGYARSFDTTQFKAALAVGNDGSKKLTFSLPRTYLYLHEWALENGNSQLGINLRLTLNTPEGYRIFALSATPKLPESVNALVVLELTNRPTQRMTVEVH